MSYVIAAVLLLAILGAAWWIRSAVARGMATRADGAAIALLQSQVQAYAGQVENLRQGLQDSVQNFGVQVSSALTNANQTIGSRLDNASRVIGDVRQQLGQLEESSRRMIEVGRDISSLQEILQPPKLRGALGELFLSEILAQVLPAGHYELQHRFRSGEVVDAVVTLRAGMVPIDAKFPLDNFRRRLSAENDEERKASRRAFLRDVRGHIDAIASKYIRMDEGTFDFALMYVPAENVYYETIVKDDDSDGAASLFRYALAKRVIPVSPNSFYAYLQTVILGLKGMRVEESAREILENLSRLRREFESFSEAFRLVGQHLDNSQKKFVEAERRFGRLESKMEQLDSLAKGLDAPDAVAAELSPQSKG